MASVLPLGLVVGVMMTSKEADRQENGKIGHVKWKADITKIPKRLDRRGQEREDSKDD